MEAKIKKDIVLVSGGFDPIHSGHIKLIKEASNYGDIIVLLNSDNWLRKKKGKEFLSFDERKIILNSIKNVIDVVPCGNEDKTCIDGIKLAISKYSKNKIFFANGGDRNDNTTPETIFCNQNNIETLWGIGGNKKSNSSSWILKKWSEK
jgi:D-beta-D-heptose 7-phosphate kinase/D-beta-D-heptose 1-phosphate adenosyltransferase